VTEARVFDRICTFSPDRRQDCAMLGFGRWKEFGELADGPTGCGEVARGGCLFARSFIVTRSTVLTKAERSRPNMMMSLH
jgi:hypothetical protein